MRCSEKLKKQKFLGSKNSAENKEENCRDKRKFRKYFLIEMNAHYVRKQHEQKCI